MGTCTNWQVCVHAHLFYSGCPCFNFVAVIKSILKKRQLRGEKLILSQDSRVPDCSPSKQGAHSSPSERWLVTPYPPPRAERDGHLLACDQLSFSLHSCGPLPREWCCPQWAWLFFLHQSTRQSPHRRAHRPTCSRWSLIKDSSQVILGGVDKLIRVVQGELDMYGVQFSETKGRSQEHVAKKSLGK